MRRSLLARTLFIAAVTGFCSLGLVQILTRTVTKPGRFVAALVEPEVTGSIASSSPTVAHAARSIALDPCTGRERLVVRGP